ncbi:hypothetical protein BC628DRAFT_192773 [Trametes gibbosa]|nr:hypothetical protein BC628DRAFT_192773 [Trametes gibbosa]
MRRNSQLQLDTRLVATPCYYSRRHLLWMLHSIPWDDPYAVSKPFSRRRFDIQALVVDAETITAPRLSHEGNLHYSWHGDVTTTKNNAVTASSGTSKVKHVFLSPGEKGPSAVTGLADCTIWTWSMVCGDMNTRVIQRYDSASWRGCRTTHVTCQKNSRC